LLFGHGYRENPRLVEGLGGSLKSSLVLNVVVAAVAAGAGYAIYTGMFSSTPPAAEAPASNVAAAPAEPADQESAVPTELPEFVLADRDGAQRSIRSWTDKSMVVNFWATWCGPCRREIPLLKKLQQANAAAGFQVVGVAVDERAEVLKYAQEIDLDYPILIGLDDGMDAVGKFGMGSLGFPFTVFTDKQHRIVATHLGELTSAQATILLGVVTRVNSGELTPAAARVQAAKEVAALPPPVKS